jgi:hypothetical protein
MLESVGLGDHAAHGKADKNRCLVGTAFLNDLPRLLDKLLQSPGAWSVRTFPMAKHVSPHDTELAGQSFDLSVPAPVIHQDAV